ncbi:carboxymuconolactone decarboxylase family protein [Gluconobacter cerinus]|uniref:carboxymuconolactone decarboxylase family protein n=1 Tax=Gluconobacter cerinus TaxID=38307 RepID=UPI001B8BFB7B|nr:carboxymuconolactone decarboxylase family protein [Gluconobacter cerinus]MBS1023166.1 carboxymuconolactone decarboxylase family protein [Gluconobacter cerinus]MBS1025479.1 carboxymuconolactone decarboxylase family protein [Gluconobacter cerinus]
MTEKSTIGQRYYGDIAPGLADYTDRVLFDDVWERSGLSMRDKSLITVSALVSMYRLDALEAHLKIALDHGVTREELSSTITHLAYYAGWPSASSSIGRLRKVLEDLPS